MYRASPDEAKSEALIEAEESDTLFSPGEVLGK